MTVTIEEPKVKPKPSLGGKPPLIHFYRWDGSYKARYVTYCGIEAKFDQFHKVKTPGKATTCVVCKEMSKT